jgi:polysaccharide biosynthesis/export protein
MKHNIAFLVVCVMITALSGGAAGAPATNRSAAPESYILGPGDQIEISIFGESDLSRTVTIKPDGTIALALVNEVRAAGKTTAQLEVELAKMYSKYLKTPSVSVIVKELRIDRVYLLGQVSKPGDYQLRPNVGIFELLASAGGPTNRADLAKAVIIRGKTETIKLDLVNAFTKNQTPDVKLRADDVLFIPETDRRIVALGEVNHPGAYELLEGQHVTDLLAAAGGPTPRAGLPKAYIMREGIQMPVDLKHVLNGDAAANTALKPGDMLVVPENKDKIAILGEVNKPGPYDLSENMNIIDAIAQAGGPTEKANLDGLQIVRFEGGKATSTKIKAKEAIQGKDASQNVLLKSGDVVYVPTRGLNFLDIISVLGGIRGVLGF